VNAVSGLGISALMSATAKGRVKVVTTLLDARADATLRDTQGYDALQRAERGGPEVKAVLLQHMLPAVGTTVYYCGPEGAGHRGMFGPEGDKLVSGLPGVVTRPAIETRCGDRDYDKAHHVEVRFQGFNFPTECMASFLSRTWPPPPLPGGFEVGDRVVFDGESQSSSDGAFIARRHRPRGEKQRDGDCGDV